MMKLETVPELAGTSSCPLASVTPREEMSTAPNRVRQTHRSAPSVHRNPYAKGIAPKPENRSIRLRPTRSARRPPIRFPTAPAPMNNDTEAPAATIEYPFSISINGKKALTPVMMPVRKASNSQRSASGRKFSTKGLRNSARPGQGAPRPTGVRRRWRTAARIRAGRAAQMRCLWPKVTAIGTAMSGPTA